MFSDSTGALFPIHCATQSLVASFLLIIFDFCIVSVLKSDEKFAFLFKAKINFVFPYKKNCAKVIIFISNETHTSYKTFLAFL